jgi:hypothetical protein
MDFDDLITELPPPPNRVGKADHDHEHHFYEGAIMVAYAMHLLRTEPTKEVHIHPDGQHGKQFDFRAWLSRQGFTLKHPSGTTKYGGLYEDAKDRTIVITAKSGQGDVVAKIGNATLSAECKGGIINTRHSGQSHRLYKGLCEAVGQLMAAPSGGRQVAVVPHTETTLRLAKRLVGRCALAGIQIALVGKRGEITDITSSEPPP